MPKVRVHQLDGADGTPRQVPTVQDDGTVAFADQRGEPRREVMMAPGVSYPADPLEAPGGGDWLYAIAPGTGELT